MRDRAPRPKLARKRCPRCGAATFKGRFCARCGAALNDPGGSIAEEYDGEQSRGMETGDRPLSLTERKAVLESEIATYLRNGYRVVSQTDTSAQLVKPRVFSCLWSLLWMLFFFVGFLLYLLWYMAKRDEQVYITVDEWGRVYRPDRGQHPSVQRSGRPSGGALDAGDLKDWLAAVGYMAGGLSIAVGIESLFKHPVAGVPGSPILLGAIIITVTLLLSNAYGIRRRLSVFDYEQATDRVGYLQLILAWTMLTALGVIAAAGNPRY